VWEGGELPAPVAATHLRAATLALDELLGALDVEEVLDPSSAPSASGSEALK